MSIKKSIEVVKDSIDPRTTGGTWKKVRNISGLVASGIGLVLIMPVTIPGKAVLWLKWGAAVSSFIATGSNLDSSNKEGKETSKLNVLKKLIKKNK